MNLLLIHAWQLAAPTNILMTLLLSAKVAMVLARPASMEQLQTALLALALDS